MSLSELLKISEDLAILENEGKIKITFGDLKTGWIDRHDAFLGRIAPESLNEFFPKEHLRKEIEVKNLLDEGCDFLKREKYAKAIGCFDEVLYYDGSYSDALLLKSRALCRQGHFVKALRIFKKSGIEDREYQRMLLEKSSAERDAFPKIKKYIYAGDEASFKGDYEKAVEFYDKALVNPSKFKDKILFKLLNKKAFALISLERFDEALASFDVSLRVHENDLAHFGLGYCQNMLGMDCIDSLKSARRIDKKRLLVKANIFKELEYYEGALKCLDEFLSNHFASDDDFTDAIRSKADVMDALGSDSSREREMLSKIMEKTY